MAVDWAAVSAMGIGGTALVGTWYQAKRGAAASDKDNRFQVLEATVDQLQEEIARLHTQADAAEERYRRQDEHILRQDEEVITLRRRHREAVDHLGDAQMDLGDKAREIAQLRRELALARRQGWSPT